MIFVLFAGITGLQAKYLNLTYESMQVGGEVYTDVTIMEINGDRVSFKHSKGVGNVKATAFPTEVQRKMGFDPEGFAASRSPDQTAAPGPKRPDDGNGSTWDRNWKRLLDEEPIGMISSPNMEQIVAFAITYLAGALILGLMLNSISKAYFERRSAIVWFPGIQVLQFFVLARISMAWLILPRIGFGVLSAAADVLRQEGVTSIPIVEVYALLMVVYEIVLWFIVFKRVCEEMNRPAILGVLPALPLYVAALFFCQAETVAYSVVEALLIQVPMILLLAALMIGNTAGEDS